MSVSAKKHLGQHFLTDENIASKIADTLVGKDYKQVLEIGPGMGVLTKYLLKKDFETSVIEIDDESVAYLKLHFPMLSDKIHHLDFLKTDIPKLLNHQQTAITGNFPYNISSQIIFKTLENKELIPEFSGMFQKEVAQRITSKPGNKIYGILSVLTQAYYQAEYLFTVPPNVFQPPPKVDSGVLRLTRKPNLNLGVDDAFFFKVVKTAFNQRRKTLRNSLKSFDLSDKLKEDTIFAQRPEQLSVQEFINLTKSLEEDALRDQQ
ncbi:16S rRNA (adenine(1518)-N(6)/adenine(1519)-N(6))-dimethyltransferase RsmA [Namhaeicola litoreus]|uniref:Ribosomal RNA small subunit methyltransferase A n=1 Tax=Namhaeicola litoreus TaxID=1052145 RepID=A0ABW3XYA0_9FLAO